VPEFGVRLCDAGSCGTLVEPVITGIASKLLAIPSYTAPGIGAQAPHQHSPTQSVRPVIHVKNCSHHSSRVCFGCVSQIMSRFVKDEVEELLSWC
jgi:hypothetical protein